MAYDATQLDDSLPGGLTKDLGALFPPVQVPSVVDEAILADVRRQSARATWGRRRMSARRQRPPG